MVPAAGAAGVAAPEGAADPDGARGRLAARQHEVLTALLTAEVPPGFDPLTTLATGRTLRRKRWKAALDAWPELAQIPGGPTAFDDYATATAAQGCAHDDASRFVDWAVRHGDAPTAQAGARLRARADVDDGRRRWALIRDRGRPLLVLAWRDWVYEVPLLPGRRRVGHRLTSR